MSEAIIKVEHLNKQFIVDKKPIQVLKDINLEVKKVNLSRSSATADVERAPC